MKTVSELHLLQNQYCILDCTTQNKSHCSFYEILFDHIEDIVFFVKDTEARYLMVNETLRRRCGLPSKEELIGQTARDIFPTHLGEFFYSQDQNVLQHDARIYQQLELHLYDGGTKGWCLTDKVPLYTRQGKKLGLAGISRDLHLPGEVRQELAQLSAAVEYIRTHLFAELRLGDVAKQVGLSISRFERLVFRVYGIKPNQLLIKMRIDTAAYLLQKTDKKIVDIALECGYSDHSAFTRQFRCVVGITPSAFRKNLCQAAAAD